MNLKTKARIKKLLLKIISYRRLLYRIARFRIKTFKRSGGHDDFRYFLSMIAAGTIVLDIGANIGVTAFYLSRCAPGVKVFAFEPVPDNVEVLKRVVSRFRLDNVTVFDYALGSEDGEFEMSVPLINGVKQHTRATLEKDVNKNFPSETIKINVHRADSLETLKNPPLTISAIKIDVEGHELSVLEGMEGVLRKYKPVIFCEAGDGPIREKLFQWITQRGYSIYTYNNKKLLPYSGTNLGKEQVVNYFFKPL